MQVFPRAGVLLYIAQAVYGFFAADVSQICRLPGSGWKKIRKSQMESPHTRVLNFENRK